jgi:hypothetical protein
MSIGENRQEPHVLAERRDRPTTEGVNTSVHANPRQLEPCYRRAGQTPLHGKQQRALLPTLTEVQVEAAPEAVTENFPDVGRSDRRPG